jgi:methyl-accepting chemotaxis protein
VTVAGDQYSEFALFVCHGDRNVLHPSTNVIAAGRPVRSIAQSLNVRFIALAFLCVAMTVAFSFIAHYGVMGLSVSNRTMQMIAHVMQRHMHGDMMHDALNSDVMKGKLTAIEHNSAELAESAKSFEENAANFRKDVSENLAADLPTEIKTKLGEVERALDAYITAGRAVLEALKRGETGHNAFDLFAEKFEFLEKNQEVVSNDLLQWSKDSELESDRLSRKTTSWVAVLSFITLALVILTPLYAAMQIFRPLRRMIDIAREIAGGNADVTVRYADARNEIGEMARSVDVFRQNLRRARDLEAESEAAKTKAEAERKRSMHEMADQFERAVGGIVRAVSDAAMELQEAAKALSTSSSRTTQQSAAVAAASEEAAANVRTVAAAAEELSGSVREIGRQVSESANIASKAVLEAQQTNAQVSGLSAGAQKIGAIVDLINDIASKTNLLALNATIEAARAGEAGRGFAVVASEVKALAEQTAKATAEITDHIGAVQGSTDQAANAILGVGRTIDEISHIASTIAAAVEEQGSATEEIARNVDQAAQGTTEVTRNITGVNQAADSASASASQVLSSATDLARQSEKLRGEMHKFLATVRAA